MAACDDKPPFYTQEGSASVAGVYPPVRIIKANPRRDGLLLSRSSIGGTIYICTKGNGANIMSLSDPIPFAEIRKATHGDLVTGEIWAYSNGGGITIAWVEFLCWPC